jgi:hypothetical protein
MSAGSELEQVMKEIRDLATRTRDRCLWSAAEDWLPANPVQAAACLEAIIRHGDRESWAQARRLKQWLSLSSSATYSR